MSRGTPDEADREPPETAGETGVSADEQGAASKPTGPADVERPFEGAFLGGVRERLESRKTGRSGVRLETDEDTIEDPENAASRLTEVLPDGIPDDLEAGWERLRAEVGHRTKAAARRGERDRPRRIQRHQTATSLRDNFQVHVLALHGFSTFVLLGLGIGIAMSAWRQFIPPEFWLLGLPLLVLAVAGLLPLIGWVIGFWNPQQV